MSVMVSMHGGEIMKGTTALAAILLLTVPTFAVVQTREQKRLEACGQVLKEILGIPDELPKDLLDKAECVIVIPSVLKLAIGIGGDFGRGAITCRTGEHFTGPWSATTPIWSGGILRGEQTPCVNSFCDQLRGSTQPR
jgi:lipid-binding SYLF domain-containing protein